MAPLRSPTPPMMMTASALKAKRSPMKASTVSKRIATISPARPASTDEITKTRMTERRTWMPSSDAARSFSAIARMLRPKLVARTVIQSPAINTADSTRLASWMPDRMTDPTSTSGQTIPVRNGFGSVPNRLVTITCRMTPNDRLDTKPAKVAVGRDRPEHHEVEQHPEGDRRAEPEDERRDRRDAGPHHQQDDEGREHEEIGVREIQHAQHPEDERVADPDQRVDAAQREAVDELLSQHE